MRLYLLGINSFIAKNLYLKLRSDYKEIICISHSDTNIINKLDGVTNDDIIINFCGINRAESYEEYYNGNVTFIQKICEYLTKNKIAPFLVHFSSFMIYGFKQTSVNISKYQSYFIKSKCEAEEYLLKNYIIEKLCIVRPSNVYGYNCLPYKNNLLVTLIHEKITKQYNTTKINKNCTRNFISIDGIVGETMKLINKKQYGTYNIITDDYIKLDQLINMIYEDTGVPKEIILTNDEVSYPDINNPKISGKFIIIKENLKNNIQRLTEKMSLYKKLTENINMYYLQPLRQEKGEMIEISNLDSTRLYFITISQNMIRGNHYHDIQTEDFYIHTGKVLFLMAHKNNPDIVHLQIYDKNCLIRIKPNIIHTLVNDFKNNSPEIFVSSTQKYIKNASPDTTFIKLV